ncbi:MAG: uroporphyrinogen-III C-methyltransferase [Clostridium sp.]
MIYLCGAGCGDWELMTLRAMRMLKRADCILYDRLLDPEILQFAPKHCECIYVGKQAANHAMTQEQIQELLIEKGRQYETVIRLKGGDPCVFGRVGEEAQALVRAGMPFEIIPGISSGIGGLAYAGIPITHRDYATGARLMSAHGKQDTLPELDYAGMAHTRDTLIFYMGLKQLSAVVNGLLAAGRDPKTPIALVSNASRATQTMVCATLCDIESRDLSAIVSPALIVIGEVVSLHEELNFMEHRPLFQKRYLLPQFAHADRGLQLQLQDLGAAVDCITTGRICANPALLDDVNLQETDILVFSSRNAIEIFFTQLVQRRQDVRQLSTVKIAVVGEKSRQVLARYGIQADIQPQQEDSEHLALELQKHISKMTVSCL